MSPVGDGSSGNAPSARKVQELLRSATGDRAKLSSLAAKTGLGVDRLQRIAGGSQPSRAELETLSKALNVNEA